jgi:agmatine/peptidylarginine deiminase
VDLRDARLNTPWIRDYGPLQVLDGQTVTWLDYGYYADRKLDDKLAGDLAGRFQVRVESEERHVDGGALISNGRGLCAMTDASLADAGMHLLGRPALERFAAELGCHGLAVLPSLREEQTGHADVVAQFLAPDLVAVASMDAARAPLDAELLDLAAGSLRRVARALGQPLHVVRVPMLAKGNVFYSYLNAIRVADLLFVPDYRAVDPEAQAAALAQLHAALPETTLVPVPADAMVALGGAIHCVALGLNLPAASAQRACLPSHAADPSAKPLARSKARPPNRAHL